MVGSAFPPQITRPLNCETVISSMVVVVVVMRHVMRQLTVRHQQTIMSRKCVTSALGKSVLGTV